MISKEKLGEILTKHFSLSALEILDESAKHRSHPGAASGGGHFLVKIVSDDFKGKSVLERHRMIYAALQPHFKDGIHALALRALTLEENT